MKIQAENLTKQPVVTPTAGRGTISVVSDRNPAKTRTHFGLSANPTFTASYARCVRDEILTASDVTDSPNLVIRVTTNRVAGSHPTVAIAGILASVN